MDGSTTPVYPAEHPALTELHRSYAHAAALSRTVAQLRALLAERDATIAARNATIADLSSDVAAQRRSAARVSIDNLLTRTVGELAATQVRISADTVHLRDPVDVAFNQTIVAVLTERIRSFCTARTVYREHRPDTGPLATWVEAERDRWLEHTDTPAPSGDRCAQRSAAGWAHEATSHAAALDDLHRLLTQSDSPAAAQ